MIPQLQKDQLLAALAWQIELGADEAIEEAPVDRFALAPSKKPSQPKDAPAQKQTHQSSSPPAPQISDAAALAASAQDLSSLQAAIAGFDGCALKKGARNTVFADGNPAAHVMIIGEAPGRDEDLAGKPFVGRSGQLLDRMFDAIGLSRSSQDATQALYITNVLPWRPPQNRDPSTDEMTMLRAFLVRHIELAAPEILVTMGNAATKTVLETATGITRMRGQWAEAFGKPVLPMFHPAALLRKPIQKREAWTDLQLLKKKLDGS